MNLNESHMIEFMVCSLIADDLPPVLRKAMNIDTPVGIARNQSLKAREIRPLWIGFMIDAYRDSLYGE